MANHTGLSPKGPVDYTGPNVYLAVVITRNRAPTGADYRQPETGKLYPFNSFWLVGKNPTTGVQGDMWYLSKIVANVAYWVKLSASSIGPLLSITVPLGVSPIVPDSLGVVNFTSTGGSIAITGSSANPNNHTINFDLTGGSVGLDSIQVQANTAPGVNPVFPTVAGLMTINGAIVAAHSVPLETRSRALNAFNIEAQIATVVTPTPANSNAVGMSSFNTNQFQIDGTSGMVSLKANTTGAAVQSLTGDDTTIVTPTAAGTINILGGIVANATHVKPVFTKSPGANNETIDVQLSTASAITNNSNLSGLGYFDNSQFTVNSSGYVQLVTPATAATVLQQVRTTTNTAVSSTTTLASLTTVPTSANTDSLITLAITPTNSSNILQFEFNTVASCDDDILLGLFIFQSTTLLSSFTYFLQGGASGLAQNLQFMYYAAAGTTSSTTYTIRWVKVGGNPALTIRTLQDGGGTALFGASGNTKTQLTITEYKV